MRIAIHSLVKLALVIISLYSFLSFAEESTTSFESETTTEAQPAAEAEALKESVLTLNRDLLILEEELLYPASSQVAIYLSMDLGTFFALDSVRVEIDNQLVVSELYSDKQTQALFKGGVQKLYIGNIKLGEHEISAIFTGKGPNRDYKRGAKLVVSKTTDPLVLELRIQDSESQMQPKFDIKQWQM